MNRIPGLSLSIPPSDAPVEGVEPITLTGFDCKTFNVPGQHRYGNCRRVSDFRKKREIGEGKYGTVYEAEDSATEEKYALKKLKIQKDKDLEVMPLHFLREINNLRLLKSGIFKHHNIVNLKEVVVGKNVDNNYLVLDLCHYSLERVIDRVHYVYLQHKQMKNILLQLFAGLEFIHNHGVIHREICPKNILFTKDGVLKITGFQLSHKIGSLKASPTLTGLERYWYTAPEILFGETQYTTAVDIWAVGCIFAEMMRQKVLLKGDTIGEVIKLLLEFLGSPTEKIWPGVFDLPIPRVYDITGQAFSKIRTTFDNQTLDTLAFLTSLLSYNPASRPTAGQLPPYFTEYPQACDQEELLKTLRESSKL